MKIISPKKKKNAHRQPDTEMLCGWCLGSYGWEADRFQTLTGFGHPERAKADATTVEMSPPHTTHPGSFGPGPTLGTTAPSFALPSFPWCGCSPGRKFQNKNRHECHYCWEENASRAQSHHYNTTILVDVADFWVQESWPWVLWASWSFPGNHVTKLNETRYLNRCGLLFEQIFLISSWIVHNNAKYR